MKLPDFFNVRVIFATLGMVVLFSLNGLTQSQAKSFEIPSTESLGAMFRPNLKNQSHSHALHYSQKAMSWENFSSKLPTAFFCLIEHKIEKKSQIPFRFRLGSLNYVNKLENKEKDL